LNRRRRALGYNSAVLNRVSLRGFKLHRDTTLNLAPLSVFIGPNNSGKSSVFQALLALRQACAASSPFLLAPMQRQATTEGNPFLYQPSQLIDIGEFNDVIRRGQSQVELGVAGAVAHVQPAGLGGLDVEVQIDVENNSVASHEGRIGFSDGVLQWSRVGLSPKAFPRPQASLAGSVVKFVAVDHFGLLQYAGYDAPPNADASFLNGLGQAGNALARAHVSLLSSIRPIYPLRGFEEAGLPLAPQTASSPERLMLPDRAVALASLLVSDYRVRREISERLEKLLSIEIEVDVKEGKRVKIHALSTNQDREYTLFANQGTGANQLPFILVPIGLAEPGETILLSEPEAHLHPKMQSSLAALLLEARKKADLQFVIETHSEHVLHRFLHAVATGELTPAELAIYYFENQSGVAQVQRLEVNKLGQVSGGLPGFFDQSLAELSDYLDVLKKA
jgi:predicted ATPase